MPAKYGSADAHVSFLGSIGDGQKKVNGQMQVGVVDIKDCLYRMTQLMYCIGVK